MNSSAACLFEKVNNGWLSAEWYSNSVEHLRWVFYENSLRGVPVNNFHEKIHLIFHLRGCEFDSDLKQSGKKLINNRYIAYHILCCKSHLWINLKKRKHFTPKIEDNFLMSFLLKDLVLVKFFNAAVRRFWKLLEYLQGNERNWNHF